MTAHDNQSKRFHKRGFPVGVFFVFGLALVSASLFFSYRDLIAPLAPTIPESSVPQPSVSPIATMSILFEPNVGQAAEGVDFIARSGSKTVLVSASGLSTPSFQQRIVGADESAVASGDLKEPSVSNYFIGNDPNLWKTEVANFRKVVYRGIYPSVDLEYASGENRLNYQFTVQPGGDPKAIELSLEGTQAVEVLEDRIVAETESETLTWEKLHAFQTIDGREVAIAASFEPRGDSGYGFRVGAYDRTHPLMIDPTLSLEWSTYFGGTGTDAVTKGMTDASGNVYLSGNITVASFPILNAVQPVYGGGQEGWVAKFDPTGQLLFSTYLGGSGVDFAGGVVVDSAGAIYIGGNTGSANFPIVNAYQPVYAGGARDWFLTKLNSTGSTIVFSTYIGGNIEEAQRSIAIDSSDNIYLGGDTVSNNFPTLNPTQAAVNGTFPTAQDLAVVKFSSSGAFLFGTYIGGSGTEFATSGVFAADNNDNVFIVGTTDVAQNPSTDWPAVNAYQPSFNGTRDVIFAKIKTTSPTQIVYSSYFGVPGVSTSVSDATTDSAGNLLLAAFAANNSFPTTVGAFQTTYGGGLTDGALSIFSPTGALSYSSFVGGVGDESQAHFAVTSGGLVAYGIGTDNATGLPPATDGFQTTIMGLRDIAFMIFNQNKTAVTSMTFLGGSGAEILRSVAASGNTFYLAGTTTSTNFPVLNAYQATNAGGTDIFVTGILLTQDSSGGGNFAAPQIRIAKTAEPASLPGGPGDVTYTYVVTNPGFPPLTDVSVFDDHCSPLVFVSGDYNGDGRLQSYDEWTYACSTTLSETTTNSATAVGYANGIQATATVTATVEVGSSLLEVIVEGLRAFINMQTGCRSFSEDANLSNPVTEQPESLDTICPGDFITTPSFHTVYYVTREFVRRPFFNALVFLTHQSSFQGVKNVTDASLLTLKLGDLMTPKAGTVLVKFQGDSRSVYALFENPADPFKPIARVLETEETARANFGPDWADFVIDLPPTMFDLFVQGAPILSQEEIDGSTLLNRRDLEAVTNPYTFALIRKMIDLLHDGAR